jgi:hypothetical protein
MLGKARTDARPKFVRRMQRYPTCGKAGDRVETYGVIPFFLYFFSFSFCYHYFIYFHTATRGGMAEDTRDSEHRAPAASAD